MILQKDGHSVIRAYIVYDSAANDICVGIMSVAHLAAFLGIIENSIYRQISRGDRRFLGRYDVVGCWIDPDDYEYLQVDDKVKE